MSIFNQEYNVVFIHVPKTAGTSMERNYFLGGGGHWRIGDYHGIQDAFKFAFVRNPWDRFISAFSHMPNVVGTSHNKEGLNRFIWKLMSLDFGGWVSGATLSYPNGDGWPIHHHFLPQWFFLLDSSGQVGLDFVGRFENLQEDWRYVCDRIGVQVHLAHHRKGKHEHYKSYYTPETWEFVGNLYQKDIELFNYQDDVLKPERRFTVDV